MRIIAALASLPTLSAMVPIVNSGRLKATMAEAHKSHRPQRAVVAGISCIFITLGAGTLFNHSIEYRNWWGGFVFAPFAILIGVGLLVIAVYRPKAFGQTKSKSRIRGWPTGKDRYYRDRR